MAAGTVVPIDSIGLVESDSLGEVLDCFFVFEKSVPYKSSSIIAGSIVLVLHQYLVEIFQRQR